MGSATLNSPKYTPNPHPEYAPDGRIRSAQAFGAVRKIKSLSYDNLLALAAGHGDEGPTWPNPHPTPPLTLTTPKGRACRGWAPGRVPRTRRGQGMSRQGQREGCRRAGRWGSRRSSRRGTLRATSPRAGAAARGRSECQPGGTGAGLRGKQRAFDFSSRVMIFQYAQRRPIFPLFH